MVTDTATDMVMARNVNQKAVKNVERRSNHHHRRNRKLHRNQIVVSVLLSVCVLAVAGIFVYKEMQNQRAMQISAGNSHNVGSGFRNITYNGEKYEYNNRVTTVLYAGVDSSGKMEATSLYGDKARADSINLVVMDEKKKKMTIVSINRDTMTEIRRYSMSGNDQGLYTTHLGYAYTYGDGGDVSCENLCEAVSLLFGEIPVNRYIVTNQDSMPYINNLVGGVTVTVPNDDLSDQYPELYEGNQVTLDDSNIHDFLQHRDTETGFSNEGRMERQRAYMSAYIDKIKSLDENELESTWNSLDSMQDYLQTNITRNQYLKFIKLIRKVDFSENDIIQLSGSDQEGEIHDEFYPDEAELKKLIIQLFYEKV